MKAAAVMDWIYFRENLFSVICKFIKTISVENINKLRKNMCHKMIAK